MDLGPGVFQSCNIISRWVSTVSTVGRWAGTVDQQLFTVLHKASGIAVGLKWPKILLWPRSMISLIPLAQAYEALWKGAFPV